MRHIHDSGWETEQKTSGSYSIAFSFLPIEVQFAGSAPVLLAPTTVALAKPMYAYTRSPRSGTGQRTIFLSLDSKTVRDACCIYDAAALDRDDPFPTPHGPSNAFAIGKATQLERLVIDSDVKVDVMAFEESVFQIVFETLETVYESIARTKVLGVDEPVNASCRAAINYAIELMCNLPAEPWSLAKIGEEVGMSPAYISRVFRKHCGRTLTQCLRLIRVTHALQRLHDHRGNLVNVAMDCGFSSHSQMTTAFKSTIGVTPNAILNGGLKAVSSTTERLRKRLSGDS